jgi:uncharacterized protein
MDTGTTPEGPSDERPSDDYFQNRSPGVYRQKAFRPPHRTEFWTGVPAFLGAMTATTAKISEPNMLSLWSHFPKHIGTPTQDCYLAYAVRGFFQNGGRQCYVVVLKNRETSGLEEGLEAIAALNTVDLVCTPDISVPDLVKDRNLAFELQQLVVNHCENLGDRFAILDSRLGDDREQVWTQWSAIDGKNGAIYYPWIKVRGFARDEIVTVPPCGHVAGIYARTDQRRGWHKAPANEVLEGVVELERHVTNADQAFLNNKRVNCLRSFPGRGIRVWGARTLSGHDAWTYVNVRRLFLTAVRWMEWNMLDVLFEPHDATLWARIERDLSAYFIGVYRQGALKGNTPQEAFYVKCDAETNPREVYEAGQVVAEIGLAPANPFEFVVVRLIYGASGVSISGPTRPEQNL